MVRKISGGLYLVIDPMPGLKILLPKVKEALNGGVDVIQLWNHWNPEPEEEFILEICHLAHRHNVPVLINENWEYLQLFPLDGIHFDLPPKDFNFIKQNINRPFLAGITCGNDQEVFHWAIKNQLDYISFCSMFPSLTSNSCELVRPELVKQVRALTDMSIYAAGGITLDNIFSLLPLGINGIAVASGILKADDPKNASRKFKQHFTNKPQVTNFK